MDDHPYFLSDTIRRQENSTMERESVKPATTHKRTIVLGVVNTTGMKSTNVNRKRRWDQPPEELETTSKKMCPKEMKEENEIDSACTLSGISNSDISGLSAETNSVVNISDCNTDSLTVKYNSLSDDQTAEPSDILRQTESCLALSNREKSLDYCSNLRNLAPERTIQTTSSSLVNDESDDMVVDEPLNVNESDLCKDDNNKSTLIAELVFNESSSEAEEHSGKGNCETKIHSVETRTFVSSMSDSLKQIQFYDGGDSNTDSEDFEKNEVDDSVNSVIKNVMSSTASESDNQICTFEEKNKSNFTLYDSPVVEDELNDKNLNSIVNETNKNKSKEVLYKESTTEDDISKQSKSGVLSVQTLRSSCDLMEQSVTNLSEDIVETFEEKLSSSSNICLNNDQTSILTSDEVLSQVSNPAVDTEQVNILLKSSVGSNSQREDISADKSNESSSDFQKVDYITEEMLEEKGIGSTEVPSTCIQEITVEMENLVEAEKQELQWNEKEFADEVDYDSGNDVEKETMKSVQKEKVEHLDGSRPNVGNDKSLQKSDVQQLEDIMKTKKEEEVQHMEDALAVKTIAGFNDEEELDQIEDVCSVEDSTEIIQEEKLHKVEGNAALIIEQSSKKENLQYNVEVSDAETSIKEELQRLEDILAVEAIAISQDVDSTEKDDLDVIEEVYTAEEFAESEKEDMESQDALESVSPPQVIINSDEKENELETQKEEKEYVVEEVDFQQVLDLNEESQNMGEKSKLAEHGYEDAVKETSSNESWKTVVTFDEDRLMNEPLEEVEDLTEKSHVSYSKEDDVNLPKNEVLTKEPELVETTLVEEDNAKQENIENQLKGSGLRRIAEDIRQIGSPVKLSEIDTEIEAEDQDANIGLTEEIILEESVDDNIQENLNSEEVEPEVLLQPITVEEPCGSPANVETSDFKKIESIEETPIVNKSNELAMKESKITTDESEHTVIIQEDTIVEDIDVSLCIEAAENEVVIEIEEITDSVNDEINNENQEIVMDVDEECEYNKRSEKNDMSMDIDEDKIELSAKPVNTMDEDSEEVQMIEEVPTKSESKLDQYCRESRSEESCAGEKVFTRSCKMSEKKGDVGALEEERVEVEAPTLLLINNADISKDSEELNYVKPDINERILETNSVENTLNPDEEIKPINSPSSIELKVNSAQATIDDENPNWSRKLKNEALPDLKEFPGRFSLLPESELNLNIAKDDSTNFSKTSMTSKLDTCNVDNFPLPSVHNVTEVSGKDELVKTSLSDFEMSKDKCLKVPFADEEIVTSLNVCQKENQSNVLKNVNKEIDILEEDSFSELSNTLPIKMVELDLVEPCISEIPVFNSLDFTEDISKKPANQKSLEEAQLEINRISEQSMVDYKFQELTPTIEAKLQEIKHSIPEKTACVDESARHELKCTDCDSGVEDSVESHARESIENKELPQKEVSIADATVLLIKEKEIKKMESISLSDALVVANKKKEIVQRIEEDLVTMPISETMKEGKQHSEDVTILESKIESTEEEGKLQRIEQGCNVQTIFEESKNVKDPREVIDTETAIINTTDKEEPQRMKGFKPQEAATEVENTRIEKELLQEDIRFGEEDTDISLEFTKQEVFPKMDDAREVIGEDIDKDKQSLVKDVSSVNAPIDEDSNKDEQRLEKVLVGKDFKETTKQEELQRRLSSATNKEEIKRTKDTAEKGIFGHQQVISTEEEDLKEEEDKIMLADVSARKEYIHAQDVQGSRGSELNIEQPSRSITELEKTQKDVTEAHQMADCRKQMQTTSVQQKMMEQSLEDAVKETSSNESWKTVVTFDEDKPVNDQPEVIDSIAKSNSTNSKEDGVHFSSKKEEPKNEQKHIESLLKEKDDAPFKNIVGNKLQESDAESRTEDTQHSDNSLHLNVNRTEIKLKGQELRGIGLLTEEIILEELVDDNITAITDAVENLATEEVEQDVSLEPITIEEPSVSPANVEPTDFNKIESVEEIPVVNKSNEPIMNESRIIAEESKNTVSIQDTIIEDIDESLCIETAENEVVIETEEITDSAIDEINNESQEIVMDVVEEFEDSKRSEKDDMSMDVDEDKIELSAQPMSVMDEDTEEVQMKEKVPTKSESNLDQYRKKNRSEESSVNKEEIIKSFNISKKESVEVEFEIDKKIEKKDTSLLSISVDQNIGSVAERMNYEERDVNMVPLLKTISEEKIEKSEEDVKGLNLQAVSSHVNEFPEQPIGSPQKLEPITLRIYKDNLTIRTDGLDSPKKHRSPVLGVELKSQLSPHIKGSPGRSSLSPQTKQLEFTLKIAKDVNTNFPKATMSPKSNMSPSGSLWKADVSSSSVINKESLSPRHGSPTSETTLNKLKLKICKPNESIEILPQSNVVCSTSCDTLETKLSPVRHASITTVDSSRNMGAQCSQLEEFRTPKSHLKLETMFKKMLEGQDSTPLSGNSGMIIKAVPDLVGQQMPESLPQPPLPVPVTPTPRKRGRPRKVIAPPMPIGDPGDPNNPHSFPVPDSSVGLQPGLPDPINSNRPMRSCRGRTKPIVIRTRKPRGGGVMRGGARGRGITRITPDRETLTEYEKAELAKIEAKKEKLRAESIARYEAKKAKKLAKKLKDEERRKRLARERAEKAEAAAPQVFEEETRMSAPDNSNSSRGHTPYRTNNQAALASLRRDGSKIEPREQALEAVAAWNANLNRERKEERRCALDLQTFTIHYPKSDRESMTRPIPKVGLYPIALIPGQYCDHHKQYTPTELMYFPVNTVLYGPLKPNERQQGNASDDDSGSDTDSSSSDGSSDSSSDDSDTSDEQDDNAIKCCKICKTTKKEKESSPLETLIQCAQCKAFCHPSCQDFSEEMVPHIRKYDWTCTDCKKCLTCKARGNVDKILCCDLCDRGHHVECLGLKKVPERWHCSVCSYCTVCGSRDPGAPDWQHEYKKGDKDLKVYVRTLCAACCKML